MKIKTLVVFFSLLASLSAHGAVQATLFHITTNKTFTVPAGKVLIIQNIKGLIDNAGGMEFQNGTNSFKISMRSFTSSGSSGLNPQVPLTLPLKVPEGWTISGYWDFGLGAPDVWIFGLIVDTSDLYASLQNQIDQITVQGGNASLGIQTASASPVRISVEKSAEVDKGWQPADAAVVSPTANKSKYTVTVPIEGDKGFFRAKAVPLAR